MKNAIKLFGVIALVAAIGFSFVSCDEENIEEDWLDGTTWENSTLTLISTISFNSPNYTLTRTAVGAASGTPENGTYSISGNTVTLTRNNGFVVDAERLGDSLEIGGLIYTKK